MNLKNPPSPLLYLYLSTAFCIIVVISNIISAKMVNLHFILNFTIPAGLITYPLTFLLGDLVTEIFGLNKAKQMVYITLAMNLLTFGLIQLALILPNVSQEEQTLFTAVLGLSGLRIFSSLASYIVAQLADVQLYALIKRWTGPRHLWLRNNGSTCTSQLIDTILVDLLYLYWGLGMAWTDVLPIMIISYAYKATFSFLCTPLYYFLVFLTNKNWNSQRLIYE